MAKRKKGSSFRYKIWEPATPRDDSFPFSYSITPIDDPDQVKTFLETNEVDLTIDYNHPGDFKKILKEGVISVFPFYKYMDISSPDYIGKDNNLTFSVKVNVFQLTEELNKKGKLKAVNKHILTWVVILNQFKTHFQFNLVKTLDELKKLLHGVERLSFDLETTGLNPEEDSIVGIAMAKEPKIGYYIPIAHDEQFNEFNLGKAGLDIAYKALLAAKCVDLFNAEFDMRFMEYNGYDMSKIKYFDVQIPAWFMDPDNKQTSLKWFEKHFLGYHRKDLKDTMKSAGLSGFNTSQISPIHITFYGAQDGISTFELDPIVRKYHEEFGLSAEIDQALIFPFMRMKNHGIRINISYIEEQLAHIIPRLEELDTIISEKIGNVNLNSPPQKVALFKSFNLDTGVKTDTGAMSTSQDAIDEMIERMEENDQEIPEWLQYLGERSKLEKLRSTFFGSLAEQARLNGGRIRINYRNTSASTGRLSSGSYIDE